MPGPPKWSLSMRLPNKNDVYLSGLTYIVCDTCPTHHTLLGRITIIICESINYEAPKYVFFPFFFHIFSLSAAEIMVMYIRINVPLVVARI